MHIYTVLFFLGFSHYRHKMPRILPTVTKAIPTIQMLRLVPGMNHTTMFSKEPKGAEINALVIIDVARADTAKECIRRFQDTIQIVKSMPLNDPKRPYAVTIAAVGMKCEGRSSQYDMYF